MPAWENVSIFAPEVPTASRSRYKHVRSFLTAYRETFGFADIQSRRGNALPAVVFVVPAIIVVLRLWGLDRRMRTEGPAKAMRWVLTRFYAGAMAVQGSGAQSGPAVFVGNHPGLGDLPALASILGRNDLYVVAKRREITQDMRGILAHCIVIDESLASRARAVHEIIEKLRTGAALVIYPAADIEPDPARAAGTRDFLADWASVADTLMRRLQRAGLSVPFIPVYTEGVHHVPEFLRFSIHRMGSGAGRNGRAALVTLANGTAKRRFIRVAFGEAIPSGRGVATPSITEAVRQSLRKSRAALRETGPRRADEKAAQRSISYARPGTTVARPRLSGS